MGVYLPHRCIMPIWCNALSLLNKLLGTSHFCLSCMPSLVMAASRMQQQHQPPTLSCTHSRLLTPTARYEHPPQKIPTTPPSHLHSRLSQSQLSGGQVWAHTNSAIPTRVCARAREHVMLGSWAAQESPCAHPRRRMPPKKSTHTHTREGSISRRPTPALP